MGKLVLVLVLALALPLQQPEEQPVNPEMQRQEIINLESEAARAIQTNSGTFFRRVYSDDFSGSLSHGQIVNKALFIDAVQTADVKYDSFNASDINVRIFKDAAIATCLWSARGAFKSQRFSSQMRVMHVYINGPRGWHVIAGQVTLLPPDTPQPL
jgi:Domain of unknown function (DUF4440)